MNMIFRILRYVWAAPATTVGLAVAAAAVCAGAKPRMVRGVIEVADGKLGTFMQFVPGVFRFEAITFGHVVLGRDHAALACLREHERVHVRQYERWGPFFFPLYAGSSLWQLLCGRDPYLHNAFEIEAYGASDRVSVHD
jgi:hypothetical protein